MSPPNDEPSAPHRLPQALVELLDTLEPPALRDVSEYVQRRLEEHRPSLAEQVLAEDDGDVIDVDDRGSYTLVRKRSTGPEGSEADSQTVSLYHVTREKQLDGDEQLPWSFLANVSHPPSEETRQNDTGE